MSRALALAALLLLAALAAADSSAESIPFAKEVAGGAEAAKNAGVTGATAFKEAGTDAASAAAGGATAPVDPDPSSGIKADPAPARR
ncbi:hypothetical protein ZWY2020_038283 [Hordeum vulgare]|nr:hypothetical protein ZWY2020_038283 [Hordeum vulgare]